MGSISETLADGGISSQKSPLCRHLPSILPAQPPWQLLSPAGWDWQSAEPPSLSWPLKCRLAPHQTLTKSLQSPGQGAEHMAGVPLPVKVRDRDIPCLRDKPSPPSGAAACWGTQGPASHRGSQGSRTKKLPPPPRAALPAQLACPCSPLASRRSALRAEGDQFPLVPIAQTWPQPQAQGSAPTSAGGQPALLCQADVTLPLCMMKPPRLHSAAVQDTLLPLLGDVGPWPSVLLSSRPHSLPGRARGQLSPASSTCTLPRAGGKEEQGGRSCLLHHGPARGPRVGQTRSALQAPGTDGSS